jgi:hypothetical protein
MQKKLEMVDLEARIKKARINNYEY